MTKDPHLSKATKEQHALIIKLGDKIFDCLIEENRKDIRMDPNIGLNALYSVAARLILGGNAPPERDSDAVAVFAERLAHVRAYHAEKKKKALQ